VRLALTSEEAGMVLAKVPTLEPIELARRTRTDGQYTDVDVGGTLQKVFRAQGQPDGSVQFAIDYEMDGKGGQNPPSEKEAVSTPNEGTSVVLGVTCPSLVLMSFCVCIDWTIGDQSHVWRVSSGSVDYRVFHSSSSWLV
jgi:hypothetical protein